MKASKYLAAALLVACVSAFGQDHDTGFPPGFDFKAVVRPGMAIGTYRFTEHTVIGSAALNDSGEVAFIARWTTGGGDERVAVFSSGRGLVAAQGDVISGKVLAFIPREARVVINNAGQVAFEAAYSDQPDAYTGLLYGGIFIDDRLALTRTPGAVGEPFTLSDLWQGEVILRGNSPSPSEPCPLPAFPVPDRWSTNTDIVSHRFEPPVKGRIYHAPLRYENDEYVAPFRMVYFGADCLPVMIAVGDAAYGNENTVLGVYTAGRVVEFVGLDGEQILNDAPEMDLPTNAFFKGDTPVRINRRGQVLVPTGLWEPNTLWLGTPTVH